MEIFDGGGTGVSAKVDKNGRLKTYSVIEKEQHHANEDDGEAYSIVISKTPAAGGNNCFLYFKNNSEGLAIFTSFKLYTASAESVQIKLGDFGTVTGGTDNTPANRNAGSGVVADVTCQDGTDITGLSGGVVIDEVFGSTTMVRWVWESGIIVPKNKILTLYAVTTNIALKATLSLFFHNGE